jgi:hypothetical protein
VADGVDYDWDIMVVRIESERDPLSAPSVRLLAVEAWRRAAAMGLLLEDGEGRLRSSDVARLVQRVREAGIGRAPALRFDNVEVPSAEEVAAMLRLMIAALEDSPVAKFEWPAVARIFEPEQLAALLGISLSSLRRYHGGARETPDDVAARLHHLALIAGDLAGAYNEVGIRRWFDRKRAALGGQAPAALLAGEWNPDDEGPQKVRALAQALVTLSAT